MTFDMVCTCAPEGMKELEAKRLEAFKRLGLNSMHDLTTTALLSLAFDFQANVEIAADMWFGVSLRCPLLMEEGLYIECDDPGDGLVVLWLHLAEAFPHRVQTNPNQHVAAVPITERISATLLKQWVTAHEDFKSHSITHDTNDYKSGCVDCEVLLSLSVIAKQTLNRQWGSEYMEPAIIAAYGD